MLRGRTRPLPLCALAVAAVAAGSATTDAPAVAAGPSAEADPALRGWTPVVREQGSKLTVPRKRVFGRGLRLTTGPRRTGLAVIARPVAPRRHVLGKAVLEVKRVGVRRGDTRAFVTIGGGGAAVQGGLARTSRGGLRWAVWATDPDGRRLRLGVGRGAPRSGAWHRVILRTTWQGDAVRATLRVDGHVVARIGAVAVGPAGARHVIIGVGRPERASARTVIRLRSWARRSWGPRVGSSVGGAAVPPPLPGSAFPWTADFETGDLSEMHAAAAHLDRATVAAPPVRGNGLALRIRVGGTPRDDGRWGTDVRSQFTDLGLGAGTEEGYLRYRVLFPSGFDFQKGGKLPGLAGISAGQAAGSTSAGGTYDESSFSGRIMWKQRVEGTGGGAISYMYVKHADGNIIESTDGRYIGISPRWTWGAGDEDPYAAFDENSWNLVELYYRMNTPGKDDGIHQAWLNGRLALDLRDVQYRTAGHADLRINQLFFAVFYGGWEVAETPYDIWIDDVAIGARRPGG
ncbi:MAG: polysaccharide lyase [Thermoleophilia bacterium]